MHITRIVSQQNEMFQVRSIAVFPVFRLLTDCVCLLIYELCLSLWKIARCSVILLLPLCINSGMLAISYHTLLTDIYNKTWLPNSLSHAGPFWYWNYQLVVAFITEICWYEYNTRWSQLHYFTCVVYGHTILCIASKQTWHHPRLINIIMI
jgi:hypothetical protein